MLATVPFSIWPGGAVNEFIETAMNGRVVSSVLQGERQFDLLVSEPVECPLYTSSVRLTDQPGQLILDYGGGPATTNFTPGSVLASASTIRC